MKFITSATLVSVLLLIGQSMGDSCKTCRGSDCSGDNVFELACSKFVPALPFESQLVTYEVGPNAEYGCLNLEYYLGDSVEQIQQCVLSNDLGSFCNMLENMLKIESCSIASTGVTRSKRSETVIDPNLESEDLEELGSGVTVPPIPDSGTFHMISFACLLTVIATLWL